MVRGPSGRNLGREAEASLVIGNIGDRKRKITREKISATRSITARRRRAT